MQNLLLITILTCFSVLWGADGSTESSSHPTMPAKYFGSPQQTIMNINNLTAWIYNDGKSGINPIEEDGIIYPRGTACVVYSDGLVWGGYSQDGKNPSLRVGGQTYLVSTQPGNILSVGVAQDPNEPEVRIYRIRRDWQIVSDAELRRDAAELLRIDTTEVTQSEINDVRTQYQTDWNQWPVDMGAPFYDLNKNGIYEPALGETPGLAGADQVIWFVCNDLNTIRALYMYGSPPLGIELQITMWGHKGSGPLGQVIFRRYRFINKSGFRFDSVYVALWADVDIGDYADDLVGCDSLLNLAFAYNGNPVDHLFQAYGLVPPAICYDLLQGPIISSVGDTAIFDFKKRPGYKNLPMTSFGYFPTGNEEWLDPELQSYNGTLEWYNLLQGFLPLKDSLHHLPFTHRDTGQATKFPVNGNPVTGIGDIDGLNSNFSPGARRMELSSGPFNMQPGDTQEVVVALVGGISNSYLMSVAQMKKNDAAIQWPPEIPFNNPQPHTIELFYNFPNPFNSTTNIRFFLIKQVKVKLAIHNILGQQIRTLHYGELVQGFHQLEWDGRDDAGNYISSGVYFVRLSTGDFIKTRKMILLR
jgi:hypothetical protein